MGPSCDVEISSPLLLTLLDCETISHAVITDDLLKI